MVEYESLLERDAILLLEHSPGVISYQEQPELIMYEHKNEIRKYFPDFGVTIRSDAKVHLEIKPEIKLENQDLIEKFQSIIARYQNHSAKFVILTEEIIRKEPMLTNLNIINNVKKFHFDITQKFIAVKEMLLASKQCTVEDLISKFGKTEVLMMLANQLIVCDLNQSLESPTNYVKLFEENDHDTLLF